MDLPPSLCNIRGDIGCKSPETGQHTDLKTSGAESANNISPVFERMLQFVCGRVKLKQLKTS